MRKHGWAGSRSTSHAGDSLLQPLEGPFPLSQPQQEWGRDAIPYIIYPFL